MSGTNPHPASEISPQTVKKIKKTSAGSGRSITPEDRAKATASKRRRSALLNVTRLHMRRRRPGEVPSAAWAIANHCAECCGWSADGLGSVGANVEACPARECWLWPWRSSKLDATEMEAEKGGTP